MSRLNEWEICGKKYSSYKNCDKDLRSRLFFLRHLSIILSLKMNFKVLTFWINFMFLKLKELFKNCSCLLFINLRRIRDMWKIFSFYKKLLRWKSTFENLIKHMGKFIIILHQSFELEDEIFFICFVSKMIFKNRKWNVVIQYIPKAYEILKRKIFCSLQH